jgi:membrane-associated HD superfamily phosphohydrolase
MPTVGTYVLLHTMGISAASMDIQDKNFILLAVAIFTLIIPLLFVPFYYYMKITSTIILSDRHDRIIPLIITAVLYYLCYNFFRLKEAPHIIQSFLLAATVSVCLTLLITFWWKISAHLIGLGGLSGLIFTLVFFLHLDLMAYFMLVTLLSGLTAFARLSLDAHSPAQVYSGYVIGFISTVGVMLFF